MGHGMCTLARRHVAILRGGVPHMQPGLGALPTPTSLPSTLVLLRRGQWHTADTSVLRCHQ
jgi:hypothetical protein